VDTTRNLKRIIAGALLSGSLAAAGLGLAGTAQALPDGPYHWCPGQPKNPPRGPGSNGYPADGAVWDMNVCHTWWIVGYGQGNVPNLQNAPSGTWDGDNPPGAPPRPWAPLPGL
jgi:hypothetical protein